jgi:hypothetical protein
MISLILESLSIELQPSYFVNTKKKDICTLYYILFKQLILACMLLKIQKQNIHYRSNVFFVFVFFCWS